MVKLLDDPDDNGDDDVDVDADCVRSAFVVVFEMTRTLTNCIDITLSRMFLCVCANSLFFL